MTDNQRILAYLRDHQHEMAASLAQIVEMESPTLDKASLDRLSAFLAEQLQDLGAQVEILSQDRAGNHVQARWGHGPGGALLLCHMDTVWDVGTVAERPVRVEDGKLYGPGAFDMKGGIANSLWAIRALRDLDLPAGQPVTILLTSDEETGSITSRPIIEAEALQHDVVFCLEPAQTTQGSLKTWRKGVGMYGISVTGRSAHAGADHAKGVNAIEELAHQILAIQALTDYEAGTTVSVGVVKGGTRSNVVPAQASAEIDMRVMSAEEATRLEAEMQGLRAAPRRYDLGGHRRHEPPADGPDARDRGPVHPGRGLGGGDGLRDHGIGDRAAGPTGILRRPWVCPRWTAWASSAMAPTRSTSMCFSAPCLSGPRSWQPCSGRHRHTDQPSAENELPAQIARYSSVRFGPSQADREDGFS